MSLFSFKLNRHQATPSPPTSPKSSSSWPSDYLPDLPEMPSDDKDKSFEIISQEDPSQDADNDTTLVISSDEEVLSTLELPSDGDVLDETDDGDSTHSTIPTGYNSEMGEIYQNQMSDPVLAAKCSKNYFLILTRDKFTRFFIF